MKEPKLKSLEGSTESMDYLVDPLSASAGSPEMTQTTKSLSPLRKMKKIKMRANCTRTQRYRSAKKQKVIMNRLLKNRLKKIETDMKSVVKKMEFYFEEFRKPMVQERPTASLESVSNVNTLQNGAEPSLQSMNNLSNGNEQVANSSLIAMSTLTNSMTNQLSPRQNNSSSFIESSGQLPLIETQLSDTTPAQELNVSTPKVIRTTGKIIGINEKSTFLQKLPPTLVRQITKQQIPNEKESKEVKKTLPTVRITFSKKNDKLMISPNICSSVVKNLILDAQKNDEQSVVKRVPPLTNGQDFVEPSKLLENSAVMPIISPELSKSESQDSQSTQESMIIEAEEVTIHSSVPILKSDEETIEKDENPSISSNSNSQLSTTVETPTTIKTTETEMIIDTSICVLASPAKSLETEITSLPSTITNSPISTTGQTSEAPPINETPPTNDTPPTINTESPKDPSKTKSETVDDSELKDQDSEMPMSDSVSPKQSLSKISTSVGSLTDGLMDSAFALKLPKKLSPKPACVTKPIEIDIEEYSVTSENHVEVELGKRIRKGELGPEAFAAALSKRRPGWITFYIDVWRKKSEDYIGLAWASLDLRKRKKRRIRSVFASTEGEAEAIAFAMVSEYMKTNKIKQAIVCSSSLNFLTALHHVKEDDYQDVSKLCIQPILDKIKAAKIQVEFWWCPSRAGIQGCERATRAAEDAIRYGKRIHPDRSSSSGHSS